MAYKNDNSGFLTFRVVSCTRMITLPFFFFFLALSAFVILDSDYALTSCPLCKSNTLGIFL